MSTDPTLASKGTETVFPKPPGSSPPAEDARLDDAIRRADDLLVQSLRVEERQRKRRTLRRLAIPIGALIMLAIAYNVALFLGVLGQANPGVAADNAKPAAEQVAPDADRAAQLAQEGWSLWQQRQLTGAEAKFQEAVKLDPTLVNAWNGLGWSQFNQGKADAAENAFKKAIELEPNHAAAQNGLGQLYLSQRKYDQAEKHFLASVKTPNSTAAWSGLARVYLLRAQWDKAAEWSQKLVDAGNADAQPMLDAAKAKKLPPSLREQITPPPPAASSKAAGGASAGTATVQRGWMQLNKGQATQAVATFKAILDKSPDDANALNGLGWASLRTGQSADAKSAFQHALKSDPNAAGSMNGLAICLKNDGNTDEAMKLWQQMVDKYPGPNAGTYGLASTYVERKQYDKALPLLTQLAQSDPSNTEFQQLLNQAKAGAAK